MHQLSTLALLISYLILVSCGALAAPSPTANNAPTRVRCSQKSPFPSNKSCGHRGHLKHPKPVADYQFLNFRECANYCGRHSSLNHDQGCVSFGWEPAFDICRFYGESIEAQGPIVNGDVNRQILLDLDCYECSPACPQPFGVNLLDNGGFDLPEALGPWQTTGVNGQSGSVFAPGYHSSQAYFDLAFADPYVSQLFQICPGHHYTASLDYKIVPNGLHVGEFEVSTETFKFQSTGTGDWEHVEFSFVPSSNKTLDNLIMHFSGAGEGGNLTYFADNVLVKRIK